MDEKSRRVSGVFAFGVGAAKTGTHSLAALFEDRLRAAHEPEAEKLLGLVIDRAKGNLTDSEFSSNVDRLFSELDLMLNVSQINGFIIDTLMRLYPSAKYILTVRDAESWIRSFVNHEQTLPLPRNSHWKAFRDLRFQPRRYPYQPGDHQLARIGAYSLDGYLSYWVRHNTGVLQAVPADQLYIVKTSALEREAKDIAAFIGVEESAANIQKGHSFAGKRVPNPLDDMDAGYLRDRIAHYRTQLASAAYRVLASSPNLDRLLDAIKPKEIDHELVKGTDIARWSNTDNLDPSWAYRSELAVRFVPAGATLMDIGCGKMTIERLLPPGCRYIPVDVVARDDRTLVCDLNEGKYPDASIATHISVLGVLEYLKDPQAFWRWLSQHQGRLIISYVPLTPEMTVGQRRKAGWLNDLSREEFLVMAARSGFTLIEELPVRATNRLFVFDRNRDG